MPGAAGRRRGRRNRRAGGVPLGERLSGRTGLSLQQAAAEGEDTFVAEAAWRGFETGCVISTARHAGSDRRD
ncbi:protein of unknown function [Burkholderia multivorans]